MSLRDYLIDSSGFDWQRLVASWHWLLPAEFTVWMMTRFGDLFLKTSDGRIYRLSLDNGALTVVAESMDEFGDKLDEPGVANDWFLIPLVDELAAAGKTLEPGQCYAFIQIPILGGDYDIRNVTVRRVTDHYAALGPIFERLKDIPDGTTVCFDIRKQ